MWRRRPRLRVQRASRPVLIPGGGTPPELAAETAALVRLRGPGDRAVKVRLCAVKSRAVSNRNCAAAMRGGEQRNENDQSVTQATHVGRCRELDSVGVVGRVC